MYSKQFSYVTRGIVIGAIAASTMLSGCASTRLTETYIDPGDSCSQYRQPLVSSQTYFEESIIEGGLIGAAGGAAVGAITGLVSGDTDGIAKRAAIGALIGGATGLLAGYMRAKAQQANDRDELRAAVYQDAESDGARLSTLGNAVRSLNACRSQQLAAIRADYEATGDKVAAQADLEQVRASIAKDATLVSEILDDARSRNDIYAQAVARTDEVDQAIVMGEAAKYQPKAAAKPRADKAKAAPPPQVSAAQRPKTENAVQESEVKIREISAENEAASGALAADAEALAVILA